MYPIRVLIACSAGFALAATSFAQTRVGVDVRTGNRDGVRVAVDVLTRGPVHEAFAQAVDFDDDPEIIARRPPPPPLDELPPDEAPVYEADAAEWIPGYWSWDEERDDYIWVSGVWRVPPPNVDWYPGYWDETDRGFEYIAGAWLSSDDDEIEYLPPPPPSRDTGPVGPPPSPAYVWVPGTWYWEDSYGWSVDASFDRHSGAGVRIVRPREAGYVWRQGYWMVASPEWVWMPAHYVYTRRGCIFVEGYWDYPLEARGVLFAPVHIERGVVVHQYRYTPTVIIDTDVLVLNLFTRPRATHYYFGDYYGGPYRPFFESYRRRGSYDPLYVNLNVRYGRGDSDWSRRLRAGYEYRREHVDARPARTFRAQETGGAIRRNVRIDRDVDIRASVAIGKSLSDVSAAADPRVRMSRLSDDRREQYSRRGREVQTYREQRRSIEKSSVAVPRRSGDPREARPDASDARERRSGDALRVKMQPSPITGKSSARKAAPPPARPAADDNPEPRRTRARERSDRERPDDGPRPAEDRRVKKQKKEKDDDKDD